MNKSILFPNEETFQKIYEKCLDDMPTATENIRNSYAEMDGIFNEYIEAISEWVFRHAYQCGYEAAMEAIRKGGAVA